MRANWHDNFNRRRKKGLAVLSPFSLNYAYKPMRYYVNNLVLTRQVLAHQTDAYQRRSEERKEKSEK